MKKLRAPLIWQIIREIRTLNKICWKKADHWRVPRPVKKVPRVLITHEALMGELPRCCTTTDQDSSKELDLEWIGPVVPGFQCLQVSTGWETKIFWHSPKLCSLLYSLHKIPLAQACFPLGERASASFQACSRSPYHAHGHAHYAPMGKWPWCCTFRGQYSSNELDWD